MSNPKWETVTETIMRLPVPGGWLYMDTSDDTGMVFVPDPNWHTNQAMDQRVEAELAAMKKVVGEIMLSGEAGKTVEPLQPWDIKYDTGAVYQAPLPRDFLVRFEFTESLGLNDDGTSTIAVNHRHWNGVTVTISMSEWHKLNDNQRRAVLSHECNHAIEEFGL